MDIQLYYILIYMQEIIITQLPKVNLRLRTDPIPESDHKSLLAAQRIYNIIRGSQKDAKGAINESIINSRKKKNSSHLREHFRNKRSSSTINERQQQKLTSFRQLMVAPPGVINKQNPSKIEQFRWQSFKRKRISIKDIQPRANRSILDNKLIKRILPFIQISKQLHHDYYMESPPIIISIPGRSSQSPPPMSRRYHQIIQRKFCRDKSSMLELNQAVKAQKLFGKCSRQYKLQGWKIQQFKCNNEGYEGVF